MKTKLSLFCLCVLLLFSCNESNMPILNNELNPDTPLETEQLAETLRVVTYNMHGGEGPNGEGDLTSNLEAFKDMLNDDDLVFLQEIKPGQWETVASIFADQYPYTFYSEVQSDRYWDWSTFSFQRKYEGKATLSKYPLVVTHEAFIQKDPGGDRWEREAQHVAIDLELSTTIDLFHYHNTYNWNNNDFESEKEGMEEFKKFVLDRLGIESFEEYPNLVMLGDFNLYEDDLQEIINTPYYVGDWRDHISSMLPMSTSGTYPTEAEKLSDHNAVWAELSLLN